MAKKTKQPAAPKAKKVIPKDSTFSAQNITETLKARIERDLETLKYKGKKISLATIEKSPKAAQFYYDQRIKEKTIRTVQGKERTIKSDFAKYVQQAAKNGNTLTEADRLFLEKTFGAKAVEESLQNIETLDIANGMHFDVRPAIATYAQRNKGSIKKYTYTDPQGVTHNYDNEAQFNEAMNRLKGYFVLDSYIEIDEFTQTMQIFATATASAAPKK